MDFAAMMKQAQLVQKRLHEAQTKMQDTAVDGNAGAGLVRLELKGSGEMTSLVIDDSLIKDGDGEVLADLVRAAYADARRKLDDINAALMQEVGAELGAGGGLPNLPKFF